MKRIIMAFLVIALISCLTACGCEHDWSDATCTTPKTCKLCAETEGEVTEHIWQDATCVAPKTCKDCGATEGDAAGHAWEDATCTTAKICKICNETEGEALGHTWADATCTKAKTCTVCSAKEGNALGHTTNTWAIDREPTCSELGSESSVCSVCNETVTRNIPMAEHTPGEWQVKVKATISSKGTEALICNVCSQEMETRSYEFTPFDIKPLKSKQNFEYDDFTKSWKYYKTYKKNYSDATESITIILFSEDNGTNIEDIELRAALYWKDAAQANWKVDTVEFIVNDKIYRCEMTTPDGDALSFTFLGTDTSYQMLKDMADCSNVKAKITYTNGRSTELPVGSTFKGFCQDIVKYNMWDYYVPSSMLVALDTTTVR